MIIDFDEIIKKQEQALQEEAGTEIVKKPAIGAGIRIQDATREVLINQVLSLMLIGREGEKYNLKRALHAVDISPTTWERWVSNGYVSSPIKEMKNRIKSIIFEMALPHIEDMVQAQISIATGKPPAGTKMKVGPQHVTSAFKFLSKELGLFNETESDDREDIEKFLEKYHPPQTFIVQSGPVTNQFLYRGRSDVKLPELPFDIGGEE